MPRPSQRDLSLLALFLGITVCGSAAVFLSGPRAHYTSESSFSVSPETTPYVLDHEMRRLDGETESLEKYKGRVVLIVNTASKCGLTPQYESLQRLYDEKKDEGLVVLGFPANNFRNQEPGTEKDIAAFCEANYGVTFPMFAKVSVKGDDICPLYRQLVAQPEPIGGEVRWNFDKFLVDRAGNVVARFAPRTTVDDPKVRARIEALLTGSD